MNTKNNAVNSSITSAAGADSQPAAVTPEQVIDQLRAVRATLADLEAVSVSERKRLVRISTKVSTDVLREQIDMIGDSQEVAAAVGVPADEVRAQADRSNGWMAVESELRILLSTVETHNLLERRALANLGSRAMNIGAQLAREPKHAAVLGTRLLEIRRLKRLGRRKKAAEPKQPDSPAPSGQIGIMTE